MGVKRVLQVLHIQLLELGLLVFSLIGGFWIEEFIMSVFLIIGLLWVYIRKNTYSLLYLTIYHIVTYVIIMALIEPSSIWPYLIITLYKFLAVLLNYLIKTTNDDEHIEKIKKFFGLSSPKEEINHNNKKRNLSGFQRCILVIYVIVVLWTSIFNVPWVVRPRQDSKIQTRVNSPIFKQPDSAFFPTNGKRYEVGYAYIDTNQVILILFATTVTCGVLFVLTIPKDNKK